MILPRVSLALIFALGLVSCGQKGPLYLPDDHGTVVTRPAPQPAAEQKPNKDDKEKKSEPDAPK